MKYSVQRKINLANIDKEIWPFETEDIGINDADSFEEAQKMVDRLVAERIGYYKAKAEEYHNNKVKVSNTPLPSPSISAPAPAPVSIPESVNHGSMPPEFNI